MKKKKQRADAKLKLVKEIVRKQLGGVSGGRGCLTGSVPPDDGGGNGNGNGNGTHSCVGPP